MRCPSSLVAPHTSNYPTLLKKEWLLINHQVQIEPWVEVLVHTGLGLYSYSYSPNNSFTPLNTTGKDTAIGECISTGRCSVHLHNVIAHRLGYPAAGQLYACFFEHCPGLIAPVIARRVLMIRDNGALQWWLVPADNCESFRTTKSI